MGGGSPTYTADIEPRILSKKSFDQTICQVNLQAIVYSNLELLIFLKSHLLLPLQVFVSWYTNRIISAYVAEIMKQILAKAARSNDIDMNYDKTEFMCVIQHSAFSSLNGKPLKLVDQFIYWGSNISFTESDANIHIGKAWTTIDMFMTTWKSDLSDKIKQKFVKAVAISVLLYDCTTWTLTKH